MSTFKERVQDRAAEVITNYTFREFVGGVWMLYKAGTLRCTVDIEANDISRGEGGDCACALRNGYCKHAYALYAKQEAAERAARWIDARALTSSAEKAARAARLEISRKYDF